MYKFNEDAIINQISRHEGDEKRRDRAEAKEKDLQTAYEKAEKLLSQDRIDMDKFKGLYDAQTIERDKDYVAARQKEFAEKDTVHGKEAHKYAVIAEAFEEVYKILERINNEEMKGYTGELKEFNFAADRVYRVIRNYCAEMNDKS